MIQLDIIREAAPDVAEAMLNELLRQRRNIAGGYGQPSYK